MRYKKSDAKAYARSNMKGIWAAALNPFAPDLARYLAAVLVLPLPNFGGKCFAADIFWRLVFFFFELSRHHQLG